MTLFLATNPSHKLEKDSFSLNIESFLCILQLGPNYSNFLEVLLFFQNQLYYYQLVLGLQLYRSSYQRVPLPLVSIYCYIDHDHSFYFAFLTQSHSHTNYSNLEMEPKYLTTKSDVQLKPTISRTKQHDKMVYLL